MPTIPTIFANATSTLRTAVNRSAAAGHRRAALLFALWGRLGRLAARFDALFARWQAGRPLAPRPRTTPRPTTPQKTTPSLRMPTGRAWLVAELREAATTYWSLIHILAQPQLAEFIAAAPQAGRILRPLCHMVGLAPPPFLALPQRPRAPRPKPAAREPTHPQSAPTQRTGTPDRPLPAYVRAAVRAWNRKPA